MPVRVVTDSVSDIPASVVDELGITIIPLLLRFGEETYHDGIDITTDQFYKKLLDTKVMPATAVPSMDIFARNYARLAEETDEILVIMVSSRLTGMYNAALQSASLVEGNCRIEVVDSEWAVMAEGFIVIEAAKAARDGATMDKILEQVKRNIPRVDMHAAFDTLEYLQKGGRIGRAQALLGSVLKINPIITLKNGVVEPAGRAHSRTKAIDHLYNFAASYSHIEGLAVEEADCLDDSDLLVERLSDIFPRENILRSRTTPAIGTHTGPGLLLVAVMGDK